MYMNKTKRNLIIASAVLNLITITINLILSIIAVTDSDFLARYAGYYYFVGYSVNIVYAVISFAVGLAGSILLLYSVRKKGKYFRTSYGIYVAGFVIIVLCGGWIAWVLLFISAFIPDIIVMNDKSDLRREAKEQEKEEILHNRAYEEKKKKIEDLKRLRDNGIITEEEYKERLFELL